MNDRISLPTLLVVGLFSMLQLSAQGNASQPGIKVSDAHPQYWEYGGEEVLLLGGSIEDNLFQVENLEEQLQLLSECGGNYVRNTMSSRDLGNVWPFFFDRNKQLFDLNRWNEEYWDRLSLFMEMTAKRGIIVQVELWATFDYYREPWDANPFNPRNNVNYTAERTKLPITVTTHPTWCENSFFRSIPSRDNNIPVLWYQQKFIDRLLSITLRYGNVLYCMDNETSVTSEWGKFWANYVKKKAAEQGKEVQTTEMWDPHDLDHIVHRETFDHPEIYTFVEISQNNHQVGQAHWDNGLKQIERLRILGNLRPVNNVKTYGADGGRHGGGTQEGIAKFIRSALFGAASVRFHRPTSGIGLNSEAQAVIHGMREISELDGFFDAGPRNDLLTDRSENEAYCRALPGRLYIVYFPDGGLVNLEGQELPSGLSLRWLDLMAARWTDPVSVQPGSLELEAPGNGDWVAVIGSPPAN